MDDPKKKFVMHAEMAAGSLVIVALAMHGAVQPVTCIGQQFVCPEPEQRLADAGEHNYPRAPSQLYGVQVAAVTTATGTAGNNMLGRYISVDPQYPPNVQSSVYRSA